MGQHLREWSTRGGFRHIPFCCRHPHRLTKIGRTRANPPQGPDDKCGRAAGPQCHQLLLQCHQHVVRAPIGRDSRGNSALLLRDPADQRHRRPCVSRPIAKGGNTSPVRFGQVFQIIKRPTASPEPVQQDLARGLPLVGMAKHDVPVAQGRAVLRQFLEAKDDRIVGGINPGKLRRNRAASGGVICDGQDPLGAFLDRHSISGGQQFGRTARCQANPFFVCAGLGTHPDMGHHNIPFSKMA